MNLKAVRVVSRSAVALGFLGYCYALLLGIGAVRDLGDRCSEVSPGFSFAGPAYQQFDYLPVQVTCTWAYQRIDVQLISTTLSIGPLVIGCAGIAGVVVART